VGRVDVATDQPRFCTGLDRIERMSGKNGYGPTRTGLFMESGFGTASAGAGEDDRLNFGKRLKGGGQPAWFGAGRRKTEMRWRMKALLRKESWRTRPAVTR